MLNTIKKIETPRLLLRPYVPEDAEDLGRAITESLDLLLPWMPWAKVEPQPVEQKREMILSWNKSWDDGKDFVFAIFTKNGEFAGSTGLHPRVGPRALETGYWIRKKFQRKGYATEAAYAMTKTAFLFSDIDRMVIRCDAANGISAMIPRKLGYKFIGESLSQAHNATHLNFQLNYPDFTVMNEYEELNFFTNDVH
jgi:RimJ/RimL family protein N-acetyltransferase